jgi:hypothetical protein
MTVLVLINVRCGRFLAKNIYTTVVYIFFASQCRESVASCINHQFLRDYARSRGSGRVRRKRNEARRPRMKCGDWRTVLLWTRLGQTNVLEVRVPYGQNAPLHHWILESIIATATILFKLSLFHLNAVILSDSTARVHTSSSRLALTYWPDSGS